ncbi:hypothetical protein AL471_014480 [Vibrio alginolyticus]|uniref:antiterminator Q family protein n=1 Tax=Vibrio alginolyticus TaxID=663 RepID=UPI00076C04F3|nr:antiterminator Q family protein [Vibrio alginolyticus]PNP21979.1 hypothetical protein AL471_014480 [Vibrio alginolyticus]
MKDQDIERTRMLLELWGDWSHNHIGTEWYREMPGLKNVEPRPFSFKKSLSDDVALVFDDWIAKCMDNKNPRPMSYFVLHYVYGKSKSEIARIEKRIERNGCSEGKVRSAISIIENRIVGRLASYEEENGMIKILS